MRSRKLTILLLGLLTAVVPFSIDLYLPAFPEIATSLNTTVNKVAWSLSSFFIGVGLGQLMYGPLLDRFGRKPPLYAGLIIFCVSSVGCAFATSIEMLLVLRFVQAIGACAATITATAMVRDLFPPEENAKIFSILILVLSISPMLAPTIGGFIAESWGWKHIFSSLTGLVLLIFAGVVFLLPESKGPDKSYSLNARSVSRNFAAVLRNTPFTVYAIMGGISFASLFAYIAASPAVFIGLFGLDPKEFGLLFAFLASGLIIPSQLNRFLLKTYSSARIIRTAFVIQTIFGLLLLAHSLWFPRNFNITVGLLYLDLAAIGVVMPNATALAMAPFEKNAGSASALLGFLQMGLGSLATIGIGLLTIRSVVPMAAGILICSTIGLVLAFWSYRHFAKTTSSLAVQ